MSKPSPHDAAQAKEGDSVILLIDWFDPPTSDHRFAIEALTTVSKHIWVAPLAGSDKVHIKNMANCFCVDQMVSSRQSITCCTVGVDKQITDPEELFTTVSKLFPYFKFSFALMAPFCHKNARVVCFKNQIPPKEGHLIRLSSRLSIREGISKRIVAGKDETRNLSDGVWRYILTQKVYHGCIHR